MKAYVFPGQGAQFSGMGSDLFESSNEAKAKFENANDILGFNISEIMFNGTDEDIDPLVKCFSDFFHRFLEPFGKL